MPIWMGLAGVAWIVAGAYVLRDALELTTRTVSVLHQQYVMGQFMLGAMLASFGMLMIGLAGVIEAINRRVQPRARATTDASWSHARAAARRG